MPPVRQRQASSPPCCRPAGRWVRGFTLVEMVISAGLLGFLAVTATLFWVKNLTLVQTLNADTAALGDARTVLERIAREVREVKYDTAGSAYCVSTMTATQMVFNKTSGTYASGCGGANPDATKADFAVSLQGPVSGALNLGYAGTLSVPQNTTRALAGDVYDFGIRYLDSNYAVTASAAALRYVELSLTLRPSGTPASVARTVVALRNS